MDEIGRGTSTFDGLSLAYACAEHLAQRNQSLCLFSTHYFELTQLADLIKGIANIHLDAVEHEGKIIFMHKAKAGSANQSYGLQVAKLAGLPPAVLASATARLHELEQQSGQQHNNRSTASLSAEQLSPTTSGTVTGETKRDIPNEIPVLDESPLACDESLQVGATHGAKNSGNSNSRGSAQLELFDDECRDRLMKLQDILDTCTPDKTTPLNALQLLYRIKSVVDG